jgi:aspartate aminotransferase-like enzyme
MARDMRIANGYGPLKGKTFRIAHMGDTQLADIDHLLLSIDQFIS